MTRLEKRLSALTVKAATKPGRYPDGGGLYLDIDAQGRRRWLWRYRIGVRRRHMGLGSAASVSLAEARQERDRWREILREGKDPIEVRAGRKGVGNTDTLPTFGELADSYIADHEASWRNEKHRAQWKMTLAIYAGPLRSKRPVEITTADVLAVLRPIWQGKPETASRVRGRIEQVLDAAQALGYIQEGLANPARWRGRLDKLLPKAAKLSRGHHAAMPFQEVPAFVAKLRGIETVAARALEFTILTAARTGEVLGAHWTEFDTDTALWSVPASRMKNSRAHRVPLGERPIAILQEMRAARPSAIYVFPGVRPKRPLSNMAFDMLLRRAGLDVTAHGFRSSFRDWAGENTSFPRELAEAALAHVVGDATERAYRRGDALERRRELMRAWEVFLEGASGDNVVRLRR